MASIPSTYVNATTTGSGPGRTIERDSEEWRRIAAEVMGAKELTQVKAEPVRFADKSELVEVPCGYCQRLFKYTKHVTYLSKPKFCSPHCKRSDHAVKQGLCPTCEGPVEKTVHNKKFCNKKCFYKWHDLKRRGEKPVTKQKVCDHCKDLFTVKREGGKPQRFCKAHCRIRWWRAQEASTRKLRSRNITCALEGCDNTFDRDTSKRSSQKYCCDACFKEARRRSMRRRRGKPETPNYKKPIICTICGDPFHVRPQNYALACTCDKKECKATRRRLKRLGTRTLSSKSTPQDGV